MYTFFNIEHKGHKNTGLISKLVISNNDDDFQEFKYKLERFKNFFPINTVSVLCLVCTLTKFEIKSMLPSFKLYILSDFIVKRTVSKVIKFCNVYIRKV